MEASLDYFTTVPRCPLCAPWFHSRFHNSQLRTVLARYMLAYRVMANFFELPRYIAIEGPIRVGKTTLDNIIAERLHAQGVLEPEDNPFLRAFYDGERGAAFQTQFSFLVQRFEQLRALEAGPNSHKTIIADYI